MNVVLYSTGCAKCRMLEAKLNVRKIKYQTVTDVDVMESKGFMSVPMLEVDGEVMNYGMATDWINRLKEDK